MIDSEKSFRKVSGLDTSEEHIRKVLSDNDNAKSFEKYGAFLNKEEINIVEQILEIDQYIPKLLDFIGEDATFSVDYPNKKVNIYVTEGNKANQSIKNSLVNSFPYPEMLNYQTVKYSQHELEDLQNKIDVGSKLGDSFITYAGVDIIQNKVKIGIYPYTENAEISIQNLYGDMVIVEEKEASFERSRTTPQYHMQGGLRIGFTKPMSLSGGCTLGYTATRNGEDYIVTAGHCLKAAADAGSTSWYQGEELIGVGSLYGANENYDVGLIKHSSYKNATNYIYKFSSFDSKYTRETNGGPYVGQPVCFSGAASDTTKCGNVKNTSAKTLVKRGDGSSYTATRVEADFLSLNGDSGAPVWYSGIMIGILGSGNQSSTYFSHLNSYKSVLNIDAIVRY